VSIFPEEKGGKKDQNYLIILGKRGEGFPEYRLAKGIFVVNQRTFSRGREEKGGGKACCSIQVGRKKIAPDLITEGRGKKAFGDRKI